MNENWLILYNRFVVDSGPGVCAKTASFDHIIRGNVFVLKDGKSAMVQLASADCTGVEADRQLPVWRKWPLRVGPGRPAVIRGKSGIARSPPAPGRSPRVPSIYEWQRQHCTK